MKRLINLPIGLIALLWPLMASAFVSGSTGVDGAFNPTENTQLTLPPSGIFNFTEVNIPAGVTVSFAKNADNTPVTMLVSGDVTIDGTISVDGGRGGRYNIGTPGVGGPGGFDGGKGGLFSTTGDSGGQDGQGPGRGTGAPNGHHRTAGGGSYESVGGSGSVEGTQGRPGPVYGNAELLPLIGGSGGGGASGGSSHTGSGGGGGGGAILITASGTVTINGIITARGGASGARLSNGTGAAGSASGGAIRIIATTLDGAGVITAAKTTNVRAGGDGRIRLEAENMLWTGSTAPAYSFSTPGLVLIPNLPVLRIASVSGIPAPANPTGNRDIELPGVTVNPVPVEFETSNIPLGTVISLTATPERSAAVKANSSGVTGTLVSGSASADINLPNGNSLLTAQTSFTVTAALGDNYSQYAQGERVEQVQVAYVSGKGSQTTFITVSGKEYTWPSHAVAMN